MAWLGVRTAVYRLYDADGVLLYVGVAENPKTRCKDHARDKEWWPQVAGDPVVEWFPNRQAALIAEGRAIEQEYPRHNRRPGASSLGWTRDLARCDRKLDIRRLPVGKRIEQAGEGPIFAVLDGKPLVAIVPIDWYRRASEALDDPFPDETDES